MRVLIAGGGTGGHLFPGLAVAEALAERGVEVGFVGTRRGLEARLVPAHGYPLDFIDVAGLKGRGLRALRDALLLPRALFQTVTLLRRQRPDAVIGVGGYASGPVVMLAALLRIPTVVLEQNSVPGVTNRILGRVVRRVFTAFPESEDFFPKEKVTLSGNPIRRALLARAAAGRNGSRTHAAPQVLVLGGSQGAHAVNELMAAAVAELARSGAPVPRVRHQTGKADEASVRARYEALGLPAGHLRVDAFIDDMAGAYAESDLIIGRAGATTLAEITALGLPAVLIPFPAATDDHQTKNARYLEAEGAARLLPQADATAEKLAAHIAGLCGDPGARAAMAQASRRLGRPDAAAAITQIVLAHHP